MDRSHGQSSPKNIAKETQSWKMLLEAPPSAPTPSQVTSAIVLQIRSSHSGRIPSKDGFLGFLRQWLICLPIHFLIVIIIVQIKVGRTAAVCNVEFEKSFSRCSDLHVLIVQVAEYFFEPADEVTKVVFANISTMWSRLPSRSAVTYSASSFRWF